VATGVELVDCPRDIHPVQMRALTSSSPSNLLVCRAAVDLIGGFPEDRGYRTRRGGEDQVFRQVLHEWFQVGWCEEKFLRYLVRPGSHFHYFLDRTEVVDGKLVFTERTPEEASGETDAARQRNREQVRRRIGVLSAMHGNILDSPLTDHLLSAVGEFD